MPSEADERYTRYVVARSGFGNVWWSLANEYDFLREKKMSDWDRQRTRYTRLRPSAGIRLATVVAIDLAMRRTSSISAGTNH